MNQINFASFALICVKNCDFAPAKSARRVNSSGVIAAVLMSCGEKSIRWHAAKQSLRPLAVEGQEERIPREAQNGAYQRCDASKAGRRREDGSNEV